jgi:hypothetical protein
MGKGSFGTDCEKFSREWRTPDELPNGWSHSLTQNRGRDQALALFERACGVANRMGITIDEHTASVVYVHCLAKVMGAERINILSGILPEAKSVERIFKEVF